MKFALAALALMVTPALALSQPASELYMPGVNYKLPGVSVTAAQSTR